MKGRIIARVRSAQSGLLAIADQGFNSLASLIVGLIIARTSATEVFGSYALGTTVMYLLLDLQAALVLTPMSIRWAQSADKAGSRKVLSASIRLHLRVGFASCLIAGLAGGVLWAQSDDMASSIPAVLLAIGAIGYATMIRDLVRRHLIDQGRFASAAATSAAVATLQVVLLFAAATMMDMQAWLAHLVVGAGAVIVVGPLFVTLARYAANAAHDPRGEMSELLAIGKWLASSGIVWSLSQYSLPWLIAYARGSSEVAKYAAALTIIGFANVGLNGLLNYVTPAIARSFRDGNLDSLRAALLKYGTVYVGASAVAALFIGLLSGPLLHLLYGERFDAAAPVAHMLAINLVFGALSGCLGRGLMVAGGARADFLINIATLGFTLVAGLAAVSQLGAIGAAWTMMASGAMGAVARQWAVARMLSNGSRAEPSLLLRKRLSGVRGGTGFRSLPAHRSRAPRAPTSRSGRPARVTVSLSDQ